LLTLHLALLDFCIPFDWENILSVQNVWFRCPS